MTPGIGKAIESWADLLQLLLQAAGTAKYGKYIHICVYGKALKDMFILAV